MQAHFGDRWTDLCSAVKTWTTHGGGNRGLRNAATKIVNKISIGLPEDSFEKQAEQIVSAIHHASLSEKPPYRGKDHKQNIKELVEGR